MTEREVFEKAIMDNPCDFTVKLVFADWLDEHDEHAAAAKLREEVEAASRPAPPPPYEPYVSTPHPGGDTLRSRIPYLRAFGGSWAEMANRWEEDLDRKHGKGNW